MRKENLIDARLREAREAVPVSRFVPWSTLVAPDVLYGEDGSLCAAWKLRGVPFETESDDVLARRSAALNLLLRSLPEGSEVTTHRVRRPFTDRLADPSEPGFAREFSRAFFRESRPLMATEFYVTLSAKGPERGKKGKAGGTDAAELVAAGLEAFSRLCGAFERGLAAWGPERLGTVERNGVKLSRLLSFLNFLLTGRMDPVRVPEAPVASVLGNAEAFFGPDLGELAGPFGRRYVAGLEIKDFCDRTEPGILDPLLYPERTGTVPPYPIVETQRFAPMSRADGDRFLKTQQGRLVAASDAGASQIDAISDARDRLANGDFAIGEYSYGLAVYGETPDEADRAAEDAAEKLRDAGLLPVRSSLALPGLWLSALPGNRRYAPRVARVTSMNFAHFSPFHAPRVGKRDGNPWGEALLLLRAPSGSPFWFSFHSTQDNEDSFGRKALGNTVVVGASGSGKTVFLNTCAAAAQKYRRGKEKLTLVFLDKDRGAEAAVSLLPRARYFRVEKGRPTGFNPFAMEPTPENSRFLIDFTEGLVRSDGRGLTSFEERELASAVRSVLGLPRATRRLAAVPQCIARGATKEEVENSLSVRLSRWVGNGDLAWVFDNENDTLSLSDYENVGIDGTAFLADSAVAGPVTAYLLHRISGAMDGRRFLLIIDEFWMWLRNPDFAAFAVDKLKTIRKLNGVAVLATQSPADVLRSPVARDVVEQSATQVFLPNPRATREDYVSGFHVTEEEFEAIRHLGESSRQMLVKQDDRSAVAGLDLSRFPEALAVLSGDARSTAIFEAAEREFRRENGIERAAPLPPGFLQVFIGKLGFSGKGLETKEERKNDYA
ncbi:MAG: hypothetical protein MR009_09875 [Sutterellaceae bacterium]|nr:hypothetical protein [Sutterellaceae bacterium]MDD7441687.1 hypothetical protein [Sutterellaceae bacterium]MDY2868706.1 hypothetical protein [Mesosutterella sp.]